MQTPIHPALLDTPFWNNGTSVASSLLGKLSTRSIKTRLCFVLPQGEVCQCYSFIPLIIAKRNITPEDTFPLLQSPVFTPLQFMLGIAHSDAYIYAFMLHLSYGIPFHEASDTVVVLMLAEAVWNSSEGCIRGHFYVPGSSTVSLHDLPLCSWIANTSRGALAAQEWADFKQLLHL